MNELGELWYIAWNLWLVHGYAAMACIWVVLRFTDRRG